MRVSLDDRLRTLLPRLHALSEAEGASVVAYTSNRQYEHQDPKGAKPGRKGAPDPDDSLLGWLLWKLERATSDSARVCAVAEAEIRLDKRLRRHPGRMAGDLLLSSEDVDERDRRIAEDYLGLSPDEVAAIESEAYGWVTPANVRRCRVKRTRDAATGHPSVDDTNTRRAAQQLKAQGLPVRSIAIRLGIPKSTVQDMLKPRSEAA